MRILTRYVLKEVTSYSLVGLLVFTFVIYIPHIGQLLEVVARRNVSGGTLVLLFLAPVPGVLVLTLPMAVLVGVLLGLSRLAADGEVIAARAVGIGVARFAGPVMAYAIVGWLLATVMSLYLAPRSTFEIGKREAQIRNRQAAYEMEPRVFIEQFPGLLLYVQDLKRNNWRNVFMADTASGTPRVTLAETGTLVNDHRSGGLVLHLEMGATHELDSQDPARYSVVSFTETDIPLPRPSSDTTAAEPRSPAMQSLTALLHVTRSSSPEDRRAAMVEINYRLALPVASLVLALVGIALGMFSRKGGKAVGVVVAILLVFVYYILMAFGLSLAKQGRIPPIAGLWAANLIFALAGLLMLAEMRRARSRLHFIQEGIDRVSRRFARPRHPRPLVIGAPMEVSIKDAPPGSRFFQILDLYVIRGWAVYFVLILAAFVGIYLVFDFFQLLGDVIRNHASPALVLNYYRYLCPEVIYLMTPLAVLMATLVNFSLLAKTSQITAIKAAGISLYRLSLPVLGIGVLLSASMFTLGDQYLPATNQRQSAYRNEIKGRPPQTYLTPDVQWIFGQQSRIFNYRFFDPDRDVFANLSIFELDPADFHITRRIHAARAIWEPHMPGWVLEDGWVRDLEGGKVTAYGTFPVATFDEFTEPPEYFKKEVKTSDEMSALELRHYIRELRQSGFDVVPLRVQFNRKFSYPLIAFVVGLIAIPFAFSAGRKGALAGIAVSIGIAIVYWSVSSLFEAMGNLGQLPPGVAAWSPDILFGVGGVYLLLRMRT